MPGDGSGPGRRYKVERLVEEYGLTSLGEELERRWTADPDERESLRDLARYVNHCVLGERLDQAGVTALEGEVENLYRLLTAEDVGEGVRTEAERRLQREAIDVDRLREDFVTYQAVRTYLRNRRGAEYETARGNRVAGAREDIDRVLGRAEAVAADRLEQLQNADRITLGAFRTSGTLRITCSDCGSHFDVDELLDRGGCECS